MQLLARLMDHVAARARRARHHRRRDLGRYRRRRRRGVPRPRAASTSSCCFPTGRVSDVQRRQMTTADDANVHAVAVDGTFDDCQALVKAHVQPSRLPRSACGSPASTRSTGRASSRRSVYYFTAAVALGAPHRKVAFTVPTGNFGDVFAGYVAARMGLPIDRLVVATNVNDILARTLADRRL